MIAVEAGDANVRELALAVVLGFAFAAAAVGIVVWGVMRAGKLPAPMALVTALTLLSMAALIGFVFVGAESLLTISATGVGALAGAVSQQFGDKPPRDDTSSG